MSYVNVPAHVSTLGAAAQKSATDFANSALAGYTSLVNAQLSITKEVFGDAVALAKSYSEIKDVQALIALNSKLAEPNLQKAIGHCRSLYEVAAQNQAELSSIVEDFIGEVNKAVVITLDTAAKSAPAGAGADAAVAAVKSALVASTTAYDSMTKAAKQVANFAEASMTAATSKAAATAKRKVAA